jgi:hydrogenase expression/formation protein HypE
MNTTIKIDDGGGGQASADLIKEIRSVLSLKNKWKNRDDDAAVFDTGKEKIIFTTDAYIIDPIFFPGGDIGKIAISGTINDLSVMGAKPIGISLSIIMENGFPKNDLKKIIQSINEVSHKAQVPIVTGDTKVSDKGKLDKIVITTSGIGLTQNIIPNNGAKSGDYIISSGDLGEHTIAILAKRFNYQTKIKSDSYAFNYELNQIGKYLNACKDPTRGGLAANIVEIADKSKVKIILDEKKLPYKKETIAISNLLGFDVLSLASEGRFIAAVNPKNSNKVLNFLKKFNPKAKIIGYAEKGQGVYLKTTLGTLRPIKMPKNNLIPRIC